MVQTIGTYGDIAKHSRRRKEEKTQAWREEQQRLEMYESVRDDVVSAVKNAAGRRGWTFERMCEYIHERCGPHPSTLLAWEKKDIRQPRFEKMIAVLRILGINRIRFE